ncbi:MAG: ribonuclease III [Candidatus Liptonbacteria bacterium]|nr:ribonuclease III [Candidatus Liptonbacteria bacterium]
MTNQSQNTSELEKRIEYDFSNKNLLNEALTHRSYLNENTDWCFPNNERMEYLGDAVIELVVSESLFKKYPEAPEGKMTVLRAALVNYQMLAKVAGEMGLEEFIFMSRGERGGSPKAKEVILANAAEALVGAVYLDGGIKAAGKFVDKFVMSRLKEVLETRSYRDAKSELQEIVQDKMKVTPSYRVLEETGPAHERQFKIGVYYGENLIAEGRGASKQEAELEAAKEALKEFK